MNDRRFKRLEIEVTINAPVEHVWEAITTGQGLESWYVAHAEVEPTLGGRVAVSWGEGPVGVSKIDAWEPLARVRYSYVPEGGMEVGAMEGGSEEWLLSHEDGVTSVRLVHSLPDPGVDDWEGYYGDIERGWSLFMATLVHYVESTERRGRVTTLSTPPVTRDAAEVWDLLHRELGMAPDAAGTSTTVTVDGAELPCRVLVASEPLALLLDIDGTLLLADIEGTAEQRVLYTLASTFGDDSPAAAQRRAGVVAAAERAAG